MSKDKKIFDIDLERCVGCYACVVACMDQNDIDIDNERAFREVSVIRPIYSPDGKLGYISLACLHCEDAPCVIGCPTGTLQKDSETNMTVVEASLCIGCHSCLMNCPYGAPKFGTDGKIKKCDGCITRVEHDLIPACVRACPTKALKYDTKNNIEVLKKEKMLRKLIDLR
ncbi:MAG: 4Fe-4S dicluster domain-containing protein [Clostridiales bacterium]|nr:4Fe-4S dicluster domain-containing protein [Clostridiales bacterium]